MSGIDSKDFELYTEENVALLKNLVTRFDSLLERTNEQIEKYVAPPDNVTVKGEVTVNTEKSVEVTNLELIKEALAENRNDIVKAIQNIPKAPDMMTIKNMKEAISETTKVTNLGELEKYFAKLEKAIDDKDLSVIVQKQDIVFPTDPRKAIPVRLSDGKSFYNAIASAIGGINIPEPNPNYAVRIDTTTTASTVYIGKAKVGSSDADAVWQIAKLDTSTGLSKTWADGNTHFDNIWNDIATITYS